MNAPGQNHDVIVGGGFGGRSTTLSPTNQEQI